MSDEREGGCCNEENDESKKRQLTVLALLLELCP